MVNVVVVGPGLRCRLWCLNLGAYPGCRVVYVLCVCSLQSLLLLSLILHLEDGHLDVAVDARPPGFVVVLVGVIVPLVHLGEVDHECLALVALSITRHGVSA